MGCCLGFLPWIDCCLELLPWIVALSCCLGLLPRGFWYGCLELPVGFLWLPWTALGCLGLPWIALDFLGFPWTALDFLGFPWIGLPWISLDCLGLPWIALSCLGKVPWTLKHPSSLIKASGRVGTNGGKRQPPDFRSAQYSHNKSCDLRFS